MLNVLERAKAWADFSGTWNEFLVQQRPEVKAKHREYQQRPEVKAKQREYYQRPEVKAKQREYQQRYHAKIFSPRQKP